MTVLLAAGANAGTVAFRSPDDALKQGVSAFNGGYYEIALPALEAISETNSVVSRFYQARIYADNEGAYTDHAKAFELVKGLATELRNIDPDDEDLAPIAAVSLTMLSRYLRDGIPAASIKADITSADRELQRAALTFNNEDAQFELAKVLLRGEGPRLAPGQPDDPTSRIENGKHWLARLSRSGHPGAQAFLAELLWTGKYVTKDQPQALMLIDVALANAPRHERLWVEDIYQNIYCNAGEGVRTQATGRVAEWHNRYGRQAEKRPDRDGLDDLAAEPVRTCENGEPVRPIRDASAADAVSSTSAPAGASSFLPSRGTDTGFAPKPAP
jgi:uncharacterized protein